MRTAPQQPEVPLDVNSFRLRIREQGALHWRDLPWRDTCDPYRIWMSEVMLQQTQVPRVRDRWDAWMEEFPTVQALAQAPQQQVLAAWQGMGYNRRALALHRAAQEVCERFCGSFPTGFEELTSLPGVGPTTAAGVRAFAFDLPGVYLETNVRAVFIHELFPTAGAVSDASLVPLVRATCPETDVRGWYYALLDYGAHLKKTIPNPSRRSTAYVRQSPFEGSHRQKRALALKALLAGTSADPRGFTSREMASLIDGHEELAGRTPVGEEGALAILEELAAEGFCARRGEFWTVGDGRPPMNDAG